MTGPVERLWWRRALMVGNVGLVVLAVAALAVGGENASLLRLGIVAGLWAGLLGAFAAVRRHRDVSSGADRAEELRTIYQLELEREITARREHELTVEREVRERVEHRERADIAALRSELQSLQETLKNLLGGDVLVERFALRAESTRLRSLPERSSPLPPRSLTDSQGFGRSPAAERAPRNFTLAADPNAESCQVTPPRAAGPSEDIGFMNQSWRPAMPRTPSWDATTAATDRRGGRRHLEPDLPGPVGGPVSTNGAGPPTGPGRESESSWESPIWNSLTLSQGARPAEPGSNGSHGPGSHGPGSHGPGVNEPESQPGSPTESQPARQSLGAHRGGRSVSELLAAYGKDFAPRPRRGRHDG